MKKIYLAIPYTGMQVSSYEQANDATVKLLVSGVNVYSPITHSHPFTEAAGRTGVTLPQTWEFWSNIDYDFIDWADELYVLIPKEGYEKVEKSTGVQAEIKYAKEHNMSITYVTMEQLDEQVKERNSAEV